AERKRGDHGGVERRQLRGEAFDGASQLRFAPRAEGFLIDDENEATARADVVVGAVRWTQAGAGGGPGGGGRGRPAGDKRAGPGAIADPDLHVCRAEIRNRRPVRLNGGEVDGWSAPALGRHL